MPLSSDFLTAEALALAALTAADQADAAALIHATMQCAHETVAASDLATVNGRAWNLPGTPSHLTAPEPIPAPGPRSTLADRSPRHIRLDDTFSAHTTCDTPDLAPLPLHLLLEQGVAVHLPPPCAPWITSSMSECSMVVGTGPGGTLAAHLSFSEHRQLAAALTLMQATNCATHITAVASLDTTPPEAFDHFAPRLCTSSDWHRAGIHTVHPFTCQFLGNGRYTGLQIATWTPAGWCMVEHDYECRGFYAKTLTPTAHHFIPHMPMPQRAALAA